MLVESLYQKVKTSTNSNFVVDFRVKYLDLNELKYLREIFRVLDIRQTGTLTYKEIESAL